MTRFTPTQFAMAAVIILGTVVAAPAATKPRASHAPTAAIHRSAPRDPPPWRPNSNDPVQTGGGSLGYNQMLLLD
jgi:hypothetical protein